MENPINFNTIESDPLLGDSNDIKQLESLVASMNLGHYVSTNDNNNTDENELVIKKVVDQINSDDDTLNTEGCMVLRKLLSKEQNPPIDAVINLG